MKNKLRRVISYIYHKSIFTIFRVYIHAFVLLFRHKGVSEKIYENLIVVSLTSYGERVKSVAITIESIMSGTMLPNKIVLWLGEEFRDKEIPKSLCRLKKKGLEIKYCKDIRSYKKLIPSLNEYPDSIIITIDDDIIYGRNLLQNLYDSYKKDPKSIHANLVTKVLMNDNGEPQGYSKWPSIECGGDKSLYNFFKGCGGTLYPPKSLNSEVFNEGVFLKECKYADDIWFWAMAILNDTPITKVSSNIKSEYQLIVNPEVQTIALTNINNAKDHCMNDIQLKAIDNRYKIFDHIREMKESHN